MSADPSGSAPQNHSDETQRGCRAVVPPRRSPYDPSLHLNGTWTITPDVVAELDAASQACPAVTVAIPAHQLANLYRRLMSQPVIEEAKGILMGHYGMNAEVAYRVLQRWSQDGNVKLRTVAQVLVDAAPQHPVSEIPPHDVVQQLLAGSGSASKVGAGSNGRAVQLGR